MRDDINFKKNSNLFIKNGWTKIKLKSDSNSALFNAQNSLLKFLQTIIPNLNKLEDYHKFIDSDERHLDIQIKITEYFRKNKFMHKIVNENLNNISPYIGLDLMIQKNPYLRIARPFKSIDNIGYHRDTAYGSSPF